MYPSGKIRLAFVNHDKGWVDSVREVLLSEDMEFEIFSDIKSATKKLRLTDDLVIVFIEMNLILNSEDSFAKLVHNGENNPLHAIVLYNSKVSVRTMVHLFKLGAYDVVKKPLGTKAILDLFLTFFQEIRNKRLEPQSSKASLPLQASKY